MDKKTKQRTKRPNKLIYSLIKLILWPLFRFRFHLKIDRNAIAGLKPPFVVLSNHASSYDFCVAAFTLKGFFMEIVTATVFFYDPLVRSILKAVAAIPKLQMVSDPVSVRRMIQTVRDGGVLCLFPQGQVSYDGKNTKILEGTGKLIKKLGVPVVCVRIGGAHLTKPKWCRHTRSGMIRSKANILFSVRQLESMTVEEIDKTIEQALAFNDYEENRRLKIPFKSKARALGLERTLYQCPRCRCLYRMESNGHAIVCHNCGNGAEMDEFGMLHPLKDGDVVFEDTVGWVAFEREEARSTLLSEGAIRREATLFWASEAHPRFRECGEGVTSLTTESIGFDGVKDGKPFSLHVPIGKLASVPFSFRERYWELPDATDYYRMVPKQTASVMHLALAFESAQVISQEQKTE
jgi:1-acyl-sn-glycerol-3-phosphate acyltransferase